MPKPFFVFSFALETVKYNFFQVFFFQEKIILDVIRN